MQKKSTDFVNKLSKILLLLAVGIALVAAICAVINYFVHGDNSNNKGNISTAIRFLIFAILLTGYRLIFFYKRK